MYLSLPGRNTLMKCLHPETYTFWQRGLGAALSGLLMAAMIMLMMPWVSCLALVPLLVVLHRVSFRQTLLLGAICGVTLGSCTSFWMLTSVSAYTGGQWMTAVGVYVLSMVILAMLMMLASALLFLPLRGARPVWIKSLGIACGWMVFEVLCCRGLPGSFWFHPALYKGVVTSPFLLQPSVFGGLMLVSFGMAWINAAITLSLLRDTRKGLIMIAGIGTLYLATAYAALLVYPEPKSRERAEMVLINANHPLHLQWNEQTGNEVVQRMLRLNQEAAALHTGLHIWTEAIVPWTYRKDDDFLQEVLKADSSRHTGHLMGLLTDYDTDAFYNSAYYFEVLNDSVQRYDKRFPLSYAESPLRIGKQVLMQGSDFWVEPGTEAKVLHTRSGNAGIIICNESLIDQALDGVAEQGAEFLVLIANDGWISNSPYLLSQHFYSARTRAIEQRKDIAVNSNLGYSGAFNSMGKELYKRKSEQGFIQPLSLSRNNIITFYARNPLFFVYIYFLILITILLFIKPSD